ncbi:MAG TPA: phosphatase PAP2 family protein [Thermoanaerobaculia bacterium]|jgi:undecaprenyl-diphosphatase
MDLVKARAFVRKRLSREEAVGLYFTVGFLVCLVLIVAFGLLAHEIIENAMRSEPIDRVVGGVLFGIRSSRLTRFMQVVTFLGDHRFLLVATPLVATGLFRARHSVSALLFTGSVLGGFLLIAALKITFGRARPDLWPALVEEKTYSFPSGHAAMSTVFFGGLVAVVFHLSHRRSHRAAATAVAFVLVSGVTVSRIYLGAHWATDTFAGVMVGLVWVVVYATGTEFIARRRTRAG